VKGRKGTLPLAIGALGVVYGDIGTSPLYTMNEIFFGEHALAPRLEHALGAASLCFWALVVVVTVKYVGFILRADHEGEGGLFALYGLLSHANAASTPRTPAGAQRRQALFTLILVGASLLYGEGIITPAITTLSAMEGLAISNPAFHDWQIPAALVVLTGLFFIQRKGTHRIGGLFGPVMVVWFLVIGGIGVAQIARHPGVLQALSPTWALRTLTENGWHSIWVLGSVVLCITGVEAMYADMGHFGRAAISRAWVWFTFPCLVGNYLGQAAYLVGGEPVPNGNLFYALAPSWGVVPLLVLATAATVVASQALISGAFSLTQQAIALGLTPRLGIVHTNPDVRGQIYMPFINWLLFVGCVTLVLVFQTSRNLAAAYGLAVTGTMLATSTGFYNVARRLWGWPRRWLVPLMVLVYTIDGAFFTANLAKFGHGGYVPVVIGLVVFSVMSTWRWGRAWVARAYQQRLAGKWLSVRQIIENKTEFLERERSVSLVVMASRPVTTLDDGVPPVLVVHYNNWRRLPKHIIFFSIVLAPRPYCDAESRYEVIELTRDDNGTVVSVLAHYGYMETPNVRAALLELKRGRKIKIPQEPKRWLILIGQERFVTRGRNVLERLRLGFFARLNRNARPVSDYFGLEVDAGVTAETINV